MEYMAEFEAAYNNGYKQGFKQGLEAAVKHGEWIWYKNHWECSVCRNNRFTKNITLGLDATYCSYCGARMDGD